MANRFIHNTALLGEKSRFLQGCIPWDKEDKTEIILPENCYIGAYSIIGQGVQMGDKVIIDAYCKVGSGTSIGNNTLLTYRANIGPNSIIGEDCVIGGLVSERCIIGNRCRFFGQIVHTHNNPLMSWDHHEVPETSPILKDDCFVGFHAIISGGIEIGSKSYVCANSIITKNVPPLHIASGVNNIVHFSKWNGSLAKSPFFKT